LLFHILTPRLLFLLFFKRYLWCPLVSLLPKVAPRLLVIVPCLCFPGWYSLPLFFICK
jgi:hypothetical protein